MNSIKKRIIYMIAGSLSLLFVGMVYAWSVFCIPISRENPNWGSAQLATVMTFVMIAFSIGSFTFGYLSKKISIKISILIATVLSLSSYFISSMADSLIQLYIGFGFLGGFAAGFTYNIILTSVGIWFPDKQGLSSGILLLFYGFSSFFGGKIFGFLISEKNWNWQNSFKFLGAITALILFLAAFIIKIPVKDQVFPKPIEKKHYINPVASELNTLEMIKTLSFKLFFTWEVTMGFIGTAILAHSSQFIIEVVPDISITSVTTIAGLFSVASGFSRVITGKLFDLKGPKFCMNLTSSLYLSTAILLILGINLKILVFACIAVITAGSAYGGATVTNASFIRSYYGSKNYSSNFAVICLNLLFAGFGSTIIGFLFDNTGSYFSSAIVFLCLSVVCLSIGEILRYKEKRQIESRNQSI